MGKDKKRKETIAVTVDIEIKEELIKRAENEERTLSNYVNLMLKKLLKKDK
jgi:hypothetical protein